MLRIGHVVFTAELTVVRNTKRAGLGKDSLVKILKRIQRNVKGVNLSLKDNGLALKRCGQLNQILGRRLQDVLLLAVRLDRGAVQCGRFRLAGDFGGNVLGLEQHGGIGRRNRSFDETIMVGSGVGRNVGGPDTPRGR